MKIIHAAWSLVFVLFVNVLSAQTVSKPFVIIPERPSPGDIITINYNPQGTILKNAEKISGVIYLFTNNEWETDDLVLVKKSDSCWAMSYVLSEECTLIACKFTSNGLEDMGGVMSYAWLLTDKKTGGQMASSYVGWGMLRNACFSNNVPKYVIPENMIGDDVMIYWIKMELKYHPESRLNVFFPALTVLNHMGGEDATYKINKELKYILSLDNLSEHTLMQVQKSYKQYLKDTLHADSVGQIILNKYPKGVFARDKAIYKLFRELDIDKRERMWAQFVIDFPLNKFKDVKTDITDMYLSKVYKAIIYNQIIKYSNYKTLENLLPTAPYTCLFDLHRHLVENPFKAGMKKPAFLLPYSTMIINRMLETETDKPVNEARFYSPKEWVVKSTESFANDYLVHAMILSKTGNTKKALEFVEKIKDVYKSTDSEFNKLYTDLLKRTKKSNRK